MLRQLVLLIVLILVGMVSVAADQWPDQNVHLIMCDVGQGDAILITHGFVQVLVDAGLDQATLNCLYQHVPVWDRKLELLVLTHPDADHIGGAKSVFNHYQTAFMLASHATIRKLTVLGLLPAGENKQSLIPNLLWPRLGDCLGVDQQMMFCLLAPDLDREGNMDLKKTAAETILSDTDQKLSSVLEVNNYESVTLLAYLNGLKVAFMADLPAVQEVALERRGLIGKVNILKVGHHGSKTSTNKQIVQKMAPEISLISVGKNNRYGHPAPEVLARLSQLGSKILRTDVDGEVEVIIGQNFYWQAK